MSPQSVHLTDRYETAAYKSLHLSVVDLSG